jgi:hypothetical protein
MILQPVEVGVPVTGTQTVTSKGSPGSALELEGVNTGIF